MPDEPNLFVKKTLLSAVYMSFGLMFIGFLFAFRRVPVLKLFLLLLAAYPFMVIIAFAYFFRFPDIRISKLDREVNKEIIYAGRFLILELESGVAIYDAMNNISKSYPVVGAYFKEIVERINLGTAMQDALSEAIETCPSQNLTKIFWQVSNALRTGSDVAQPLKDVVENLVKEQQILVTEYGRKLNPLAMFYMMIAIIVPSLGVTLLTIISIFMGIALDKVILLAIAGFIGFIQFMFVAMINSIRPPVEL